MEWEEQMLGNIGEILGGGTPASANRSYWDGDVPWISSSDISENDINSIKISRFISHEAIDKSATKLCSAPVVLIVSRVGVGKVAHSTKDICTSQDFTNIINTKCNSLFLSYLLSNVMRDKAKSTQGTSIKGITSSEIKNIKIYTPPNSEQEKIVALLSLIDQRIKAQSKIIEEMKLLNNTFREKIFSTQFRFKKADGSNYADWQEMTLGNVGDVKMCRRIFNEETSAVDEIPFFKIGSFGRKADAYISRKLYEDYKKRFPFPKKGDVLISAAGTIGRTIVYNGEDAYFQDSNIVWIDNDDAKVSNDFLFYILQIVKYNTEGGTIQRLYNSILKSTKFTSPEYAEQSKIASFLKLLEEKIAIEQKVLKGFQRQKQHLLQNLFI